MKLRFVDRHGTRFVKPTKSSPLGNNLLKRFAADRVAFLFQPAPASYTVRKLPRQGETLHLLQAWTRRPYTAEIEWIHILPLRSPRSTAIGMIIFSARPRPVPVR